MGRIISLLFIFLFPIDTFALIPLNVSHFLLTFLSDESYRPVTVYDPSDYLKNPLLLLTGIRLLREYDFIIVGAGSAGCTLASRLSELSQYRVLLIEAGGRETIPNDIPIFAQYLQRTEYNWNYITERQNSICLAMVDQKCTWPRGRAVGGSSSINYMVYTRGHKVDWDLIGANNPGWSYNDVFPYFLKSERSQLKGLENSTNHNKNGLLSVQDVNFRTSLGTQFVEAGKELGYDTTSDYNNAGQLGFHYVQSNTLNGKRHSASKAFLTPAKFRENLHVADFSTVMNITINPITKVAHSVTFIHDNRIFVVKAKKEIILSAGVLSSPKILMNSGVGPRSHLLELGIPIVKDLPVGETLYDHPGFLGLPFLINKTGASLVENDDVNLLTTVQWSLFGTGPLASIGGIEGLGFIKTNASTSPLPHYPDVELLFFSGSANSDSSQSTRAGLGMSQEFYDGYYKDIANVDVWSAITILLHPKSKGYLRLRDKNPFSRPIMYHNYLTAQEDVDTMVQAIKFTLRLAQTNAFQTIGSTLYNKAFPTCTSYTFGTDAYWECCVRSTLVSFHHQTTTCKMGPSSDSGAVVDNKLRVYGIRRLRIADTSIIPIPITAHTHAPAVMIGEKLADMLKATWS